MKKQFNLLLVKKIDNVINYLNTTIKSYNSLTRTNIKKDLLNTLTNSIALLTKNINNNLSINMSKLSTADSTSLDYNTQLTDINKFNNQLEEYINIDNLINKYNDNIKLFSLNTRTNTKTNANANTILDKSSILPIYERNFDRINQMLNSDFNDNENEHSLADKYSKAYMELVESKQKDDLDVNPLRLGSQIESGIISFLTNLSGKGKTNTTPSNSNTTPSNSNTTPSNSNSRGSYLLNKDTNTTMVEGFLPNTTLDTKTSKNSFIDDVKKTPNKKTNEVPDIKNINMKNAINNTSNTNKTNKTNKNNTNNILSQLVSGNFIQFIMNSITDNFKLFTQYYNANISSNTESDKKDNENTFKLEDNMMPAGLLLFILSMLIYFIDITS